MDTEIYWIEFDAPGRLAIMPKPWGHDRLDSEILSLAEDGVQILVSMLPPEEALYHGLEDEAVVARRHGLEFHNLEVPDHTVPPDPMEAWTLARRLAGEIRAGRSVAVHCYAGIGRSALMCACILASLGAPLEEAWNRISEARGFTVPETREQRTWPLVTRPEKAR